MLAATSALALIGCGQNDEPGVIETTTGDLDPPPRMRDEDDTPPPMQPPGMQMETPTVPPEPELDGGPLPNGLELPAGYRNWSVIGVSDPAGDTIRVIIGNRTAVNAARNDETNPWPDGSMLAHYVWTESENAYIPGATSAGAFRALTLMVKDSEAYADDGGWAYGRWLGPTLEPDEPGFDRACVNCHTDLVSDNDFVFTRPGALPAPTAIGYALPVPSDLALPGDILEWAVVGVVNRQAENGSIRVIVGNREAVVAAREGLDDGQWPTGSMLAHYSWEADDNPDDPDMVAPGVFQQITLMEKQGEDYGVDGGWKYGVWATAELARATDPEFDRACVNCHTNLVPDNDFVFTVPGPVP